jgi:hypothetical protein
MKRKRPKRIITFIVLSALAGASLVVYQKAYVLVYAKAKQEAKLKDEMKKALDAQRQEKKALIAKIVKLKQPYLNDLMTVEAKHHLEINTLLYLANLTAQFDIKPSEIVEMLVLISFECPERTKQRALKILAEQKNRLYWHKTGKHEKRSRQIKQKEALLTQCRLQLAISEIISRDEQIKEELQVVQAALIKDKWPRLSIWKGPEGGGGH